VPRSVSDVKRRERCVNAAVLAGGGAADPLDKKTALQRVLTSWSERLNREGQGLEPKPEEDV